MARLCGTLQMGLQFAVYAAGILDRNTKRSPRDLYTGSPLPCSPKDNEQPRKEIDCGMGGL